MEKKNEQFWDELEEEMQKLSPAQKRTLYLYIMAMSEKTANGEDPKGPRYYSLKEIQPMLSVSYRTLQNWVKSGYIPVVKIGGRWKIEERELAEFLGKQMRNK